MATTYSITGNSSVYEGGRISLAVTSSLPRPTVMPTGPEPTINYIIPYTITGIDPARVGVGSKPLSGTLDFRNSFLIIDLSIVANQRTDGPTTVTVNIDNGAYTYDVQIIDSSRESNIPSLTAGKGNYDEGTSAIFTLTNGTPNSYGQYYLSGISSADTSHSGLYGNFSVGTVLIDSSGSGTITISLLNDGLTEGSETLAVRLAPYGLTSTIVINDTSSSLSVTPVQPVITQPISSATTTPIFSASNFISIPTGSLATNSTAANDLITGTTAIDTVVFKGSIKDYKVAIGSNGNYSVIDAVLTRDGSDLVVNVERLKFLPDPSTGANRVALDLNPTQASGKAALLIGAVLPGKLALDASKYQLMGTVIDLLDQGFSLQLLSGALLRLPIWDILTGKPNPTKADVATYLVNNVYGVGTGQTANLGADLARSLAIDAMNAETTATQGTYLATLATSTASQNHIDLVGIQATGLVYLG